MKPRPPDPEPRSLGSRSTERGLEDAIDETIRAERAADPGSAESRAFLARMRPRLDTRQTAPRHWIRTWSMAATIPILVTLAYLFASSNTNPPELPEADVPVVANLEILELLDGLPQEALESELDGAALVELLENIELLESLDPELLEGGDEAG